MSDLFPPRNVTFSLDDLLASCVIQCGLPPSISEDNQRSVILAINAEALFGRLEDPWSMVSYLCDRIAGDSEVDVILDSLGRDKALDCIGAQGVVEHFGADSLLKEIGRDKALLHFGIKPDQTEAPKLDTPPKSHKKKPVDPTGTPDTEKHKEPRP